MKSIVAVDSKWGIGKKNDLLFHLSKDMSFFREKTLHKVIVMGSNTLKSFPGGNPLKGRINVVFFPGGEKRDDCIVVDDIEELKTVLAQYPTDNIYVVGGAMFYRTMLPYCDTAFVTKVEADGKAEVFYEDLDKSSTWEKVNESAPIEDNGYIIRFCTYKNNATIDFCGGNND